VGIPGFLSVIFALLGLGSAYPFSSFPSESCLFCQLMQGKVGAAGGSGKKWYQIFSVYCGVGRLSKG
jgi:hypothetical protein